MATPSPGAWAVAPLQGPNYFVIDRDKKHVCRVTERSDAGPEGDLANAVLLAAAPDLLAACKEALRRLKQDGYEPHHYGGEVLVQLQSAIAQTEPRP